MNNRNGMNDTMKNGHGEIEYDELKQDPDIVGRLGNLGADLISLGELQLELLSVDTRDATSEAFYPTIIACLGIGFVIGSCPLALLGLSWWLTDATTLSLASSSLIIALAGLVLAVLLLFVAWKGLKKSFALINRSRKELRSNLKWIKNILSEKHRGRRWPR